MVLIEVIFYYNYAKYDANFVILLCLNLLKRFPPHFNCTVTLPC